MENSSRHEGSDRGDREERPRRPREDNRPDRGPRDRQDRGPRNDHRNDNLKAMDPAERRIIHSFFQDAPRFRTTSLSEGHMKRIEVSWTDAPIVDLPEISEEEDAFGNR